MNFQNLQDIKEYDFYLDVAFSRAKKKVKQLTGTKKKYRYEDAKARDIEITRINSVRETLNDQLNNILGSFPSFDSLSEFYQELIGLYHPIKDIKKALSSLDWAIKRNNELSRSTLQKIKMSREKDEIEETRKSYYGRLSSVMKQINSFLKELERARKDLKSLPAVKDSLFTIAIVGFPNVGKSTLLSKLTFSIPEAKAYAFTTKGLNMGYSRIKHEKVQFVDTPGTLDRPEKMNYIERQAELAIKYLAEVLIYVFDITEPYPLEMQKKLYNKIKKTRKPILLYLSKTDILEKEKIDEFRKKYKDILTNPEEIMEKLVPLFNRRL
ncbi:MAG: GTPase [Candidatus Woesearchaeota archaeon]